MQSLSAEAATGLAAADFLEDFAVGPPHAASALDYGNSGAGSVAVRLPLGEERCRWTLAAGLGC